MKTATDRLIFALDVDSFADAQQWVRRLRKKKAVTMEEVEREEREILAAGDD